MKNIIIVIVAFFLLSTVACTKKIAVGKLSEIYPAMPCADFITYLKQENILYDVEDGEYQFKLKDVLWERADIECNKTVSSIEFESKRGTSPRESKAYIGMQAKLMNLFRDSEIIYEEENRAINFSNGIKLYQYVDADAGAITHFKISIENRDGAKSAWEKAIPIIVDIGKD